MRLLFVVQRYGEEVAGGAEAHCRAFATRLAQLGHEVEVVTSCALHYSTWANHYPEGTSVLEDVRVHRLPTNRRRDEPTFAPLSMRVLAGEYPTPLHVEQEWFRAQGPTMPALSEWLQTHASRFDVVIFFTYLYFPTVEGVAAVAGRSPVVLHPTAHDEPPFHLPMLSTMFHLVDGLALSTAEERELVERVFAVRPRSAIIGIGAELPAPDRAVDGGDAFRRHVGLGRGDPYLLCIGRIDPSKGTPELVDFFSAYKRRHATELRLALIGETAHTLAPTSNDVLLAGVVDESLKRSALDGAFAVVIPSYFESFSMVLTEAWAARRAALVQGRCPVLAGQASRSGGALPYAGYAEFEAALEELERSTALREVLANRGRTFVEEHYRWPVVMDRYESLLRDVVDNWSAPRAGARA